MASLPDSITAACITVTALATIAVVLRLYAQREVKPGLHKDDYFIIISLLICIGMTILTVYGVYEGGFGYPTAELDPDTKVRFAQLLFAHQFFWTTSVSMVKISLLCFYRRIFTTPSFKLASTVVMALVVAWCIAINFGVLFSKTPIQSQWTSAGYFNINWPAFLIAACVTDMILDLIVLALPTSVIRTLQISTRKKGFLIVIFTLGVFCTVSSVVRIVFIVRLTHEFSTPAFVFSRATSEIILWSIVEPNIGIVTASLPLMGPLIREVDRTSVVRSMRSFASRNGGSEGSSGKPYARGSSHDRVTWIQLSNNRQGYSASVTGASDNDVVQAETTASSPEPTGSRQILVQHTITTV